jgi:hypothetical protein
MTTSRKLACFCLAAAWSAGSPCFGATDARSIWEIVSELRRLYDSSEPSVDVPPDVSRTLTALKHRLRGLLVETLGAPDTVAAGWKYKPGRIDGQAVKVSLPVSVTFEP